MSWQDLAKKCANIYGVQHDIVLATVEAETGGRNVLGDGGRAFGYGQVWIKWHYDNLLKVANDMKIKIPAKPTTEAAEQPFKPIILGNDELSMRLAVYTIKMFWDNTGRDWDKFTKRYVGPAIPQADYNRRLKIWDKYRGSSSQGNNSANQQTSLPSSLQGMGENDIIKYAAIGVAVMAAIAAIK